MPGLQIQFEAIDQASPTIQKLSQMMVDAAKNSDRFAKEIFDSSNRIDTGLKKISGSGKETKQSIESVKDATNQLATSLLGIASVAGLTTFFKSSAEAALEEEEALRRLAFAVDATGGSFQQSKEAILAFANQQQAFTQFSDTQTFEAMGRLVRITGDVGQAMQATRLAFGLASASGRDLGGILDLLSPILQGDATRLRALKNEFGAFIGNANTAQEVVDVLSRRFLGAAETQEGYAKQLAISRNELGNFKETVGAGVLPAFNFLLGALTKVTQFFEILGVVIANWAAHARLNVKDFAEFIKEVFTLNFDGAQERHKRFAAEFASIEETSAEQAAEIDKRYSKERQLIAQDEQRIKTGITQKSVEESRKEAEEKKKAAQDAHDTLTRLDSERLELEGEKLESKLEMIELEKEQRLRQLDEIAAKGILTEEALTQARINAVEIAKLKSKEARESLDEDMKALEEGAKSVASTFANSVGDAMADVILEGKNMQAVFDSVFKSVLRTAIETFTRIAIEAAILRGSTGGLGVLGGIFAVGAIGGGAFKGIKLAEGGIVRRPTFAQVGEAGPEAVIPLDRLGNFGGSVNVTVTQNNTINIQGASDEQVRTLMRRISEATRSGAAEGAELVKSILSKQDRFAREAV
ncbi:MAG: hypothetical protein KCHDKBKB_01936 [Elusimicrobia bacterium]|nr:hypothetical protein [Elusimicrobiota bacterium]